MYVNDLVNRHYLGPPSISPPSLCSGRLIVFHHFHPTIDLELEVSLRIYGKVKFKSDQCTLHFVNYLVLDWVEVEDFKIGFS